jgi:hypothetical protein
MPTIPHTMGASRGNMVVSTEPEKSFSKFIENVMCKKIVLIEAKE